jgi:hypothetical protein
MQHLNKYLETFISLSTFLTGFNQAELEATGMVGTYFKTVLARTEPSVLELFFEKAEAILAMKEEDRKLGISSQLMPDSSYNGLAKRIILLWYEGQWITAASREVICAESYIQGLMWPAAKTHPSGAKQPGYGSWAQQPF